MPSRTSCTCTRAWSRSRVLGEKSMSLCLGDTVYYNYNKEPPEWYSIGNYLGPYRTCARARKQSSKTLALRLHSCLSAALLCWHLWVLRRTSDSTRPNMSCQLPKAASMKLSFIGTWQQVQGICWTTARAHARHRKAPANAGTSYSQTCRCMW